MNSCTKLALLLSAAGCGAAQGSADGADTASNGVSNNGGSESGTEPAAPSVTPEQFGAAAPSAGEPDGAADGNGGAWRIIEVPAASNQPEIVHTPVGWLALSRRSLGDTRAPSAWQSVLYRSTDGVSWQSVPLDPGHDDLQLSGLAYGAGRYVMLGTRTGGQGVSWSSADAEHWTQTAQPNDSVNVWRGLGFAGSHFFGFGFQYLGVSETGESWSNVRISNVQAQAVAYGNGRYLLVGSGPKQISEDGSSWRESISDCALPGACITDPSGRVSQSIQYHAVFAEGRFFTDQLSSADGTRWEAMPERFPSAYVSGRFLGQLGLTTLESWSADGPLQPLRVTRPARAAAVTLSTPTSRRALACAAAKGAASARRRSCACRSTTHRRPALQQSSARCARAPAPWTRIAPPGRPRASAPAPSNCAARTAPASRAAAIDARRTSWARAVPVPRVAG